MIKVSCSIRLKRIRGSERSYTNDFAVIYAVGSDLESLEEVAAVRRKHFFCFPTESNKNLKP